MRRIGYGWKRDEAALREAGADVVYIDTTPERPERNALFEHAALREGDEVVVLSRIDLGGSKPASDRIAALIEERGARVVETGDEPGDIGRPRKFCPDEWQDEDIREIWLSPIYSQAYKLQRAAQIMGRPIPAHQLHYRYGSWKSPKETS